VKRLMLAMVVVGAALLGVILYQADLSEAWRLLSQVGVSGMALLLSVYVVGGFGESASWLFTLPSLVPGPRWQWRFFRMWIVGMALEYVTPLASLGGEPMKAILLKRHYGVPYRDGSASLVLTRMTDLVAQVLFMAIGLGLMFRDELLPAGYRIGALAGLVIFAVAILGFFLVQTNRVFSRLRGWLERGRLGARLSERALAGLDAVHDVETQLVEFYSARRLRFALSVAVAFAGWSSGALAAWWALDLLGHPVSFSDAFVIEAFMLLVRSTLFFVPADLGTQEGALVLSVDAITGSPSAGVALAAIRRARDIVFVLVGLALGVHYSVTLRDLGEELPAPARGQADSGT